MQNNFGDFLKRKRLEKNLTQKQLAMELFVSESAVSKWEKGEVVNIKREYIDKMAKIFDVSPQWLMGYETAPEVTLTYEAPGHDTIKTTVGGKPIIGPASKRAELYQAALQVKTKNIDVAIQLLKSLS